MLNFIDYYEYSKLATAAYVDLTSLDGAAIAAAANTKERLPEALAQQTFVATTTNPAVWTVPVGGYHGNYHGNDTSGFAATLFEKSGQKVLAIRGTEPSANFGQDLFQADLAGIGILGLAASQAVEMINYIRRLITPAGQPVERLELHSSNTVPGVPSVKAAGNVVGLSVYFYCTTTQDTGLGLIGPNEKITVTGHSLGGHLAALAARLFPSVISDAYLYNAPGFDPSTASFVPGSKDIFAANLAAATGPATLAIGTIAQQLTEPFINLFDRYLGYGAASSFGEVSSRIHNFESEDIAPGNDNSGVSSILTGAHNLPAETFIPTERNSHLIEPFMDSLSMQSVLCRMKSDITPNQVETLFRAVSTSDADVLEKLVVSLRDVLVGKGQPLEKIADALDGLSGSVRIGTGDIAARRDYYSVFLEVEKAVKANPNLILETLIDRSPGVVANLARDGDIDANAYRYALKAGNPFAVLGADYTIHNQHGELDLYDEATGQGELTSEWITDRSKFLAWMIQANTEDKTNISDGGEQWLAEDRALQGASEYLPYSLDINSGLLGTTSDARKMIFGKDTGADDIAGGDKDDRLYGMGGNDRIVGNDGDDYIEGNSGNDQVEGGLGNDMLLGGKGNDVLNGEQGADYIEGNAGDDTLKGGEGNDILKGGDGTDTYEFKENYGIDIVTDRNAGGVLKVDDQTLNGGAQTFENIYKNETSGQIFVRLNDNNSLVILKSDNKNRIVVSDWSGSNSLGINLQDVAAEAPSVTFAGDFKKAIDGNGDYVMAGDNYAAAGTEVNALDLISGSGGNDVIAGLGGDDSLSGMGGDDYVDGGLGSDQIQGGLGKDRIYGGVGDDAIYGSSDLAIIGYP